jgi:CO/xanthine dehydrogenase Mo-binding subunit
MFRNISGSNEVKIQQMHKEINGFYEKLATRAVRKPRSEKWVHLLPKGIFFPDVPGYRPSDLNIREMSINDGIHFHGIMVATRDARLKEPLHLHLGRKQKLYVRGNIYRIDAELFATYMAHVAEVEVSKSGAVRVRRVVCAVDCGTVVNPDTVRAQIQSAIMFGITAALHGKITLKNGRIEQTNFDTYEILRINEAPAVEVHIVQSSQPPGGMGEAGTSAVVPAVANAIFAATGKRLRKLPVDTAALKQPA